MSLPTPNYVLVEKITISVDLFDEKTLDAGTFVRPIESVYLPEHIKTSFEFRHYDPEVTVFCYTRAGIVPIDKDKMRRV